MTRMIPASRPTEGPLTPLPYPNSVENSRPHDEEAAKAKIHVLSDEEKMQTHLSRAGGASSLGGAIFGMLGGGEPDTYDFTES